MLKGIRGAITVENNTESDIKNATIEVLNKMLKENNVELCDIAAVNFTMTKDLDVVYPAKFAREYLNFSSVPMMCYQELDIKNSLKKCIRVLFLVNSEKKQNEIKHIYLKDAKKLRPDL